MTQGIADRIKQLRNEKPTMTIGVLANWTGEARQICDYLVKAGIADVQLLSPEGYLTSTVTVCPILLSKGLEFDAVLVAGVHAKNFTDNDFDNRLLYMACTRAKHNLSLHWFGHLSPTLKIIHVH
jgi:DNA helicase-2/ATP-dependent DNA helicase PcrA